MSVKSKQNDKKATQKLSALSANKRTQNHSVKLFYSITQNEFTNIENLNNMLFIEPDKHKIFTFLRDVTSHQNLFLIRYRKCLLCTFTFLFATISYISNIISIIGFVILLYFVLIKEKIYSRLYNGYKIYIEDLVKTLHNHPKKKLDLTTLIVVFEEYRSKLETLNLKILIRKISFNPQLSSFNDSVCQKNLETEQRRLEPNEENENSENNFSRKSILIDRNSRKEKNSSDVSTIKKKVRFSFSRKDNLSVSSLNRMNDLKSPRSTFSGNPKQIGLSRFEKYSANKMKKKIRRKSEDLADKKSQKENEKILRDRIFEKDKRIEDVIISDKFFNPIVTQSKKELILENSALAKKLKKNDNVKDGKNRRKKFAKKKSKSYDTKKNFELEEINKKSLEKNSDCNFPSFPSVNFEDDEEEKEEIGTSPLKIPQIYRPKIQKTKILISQDKTDIIDEFEKGKKSKHPGEMIKEYDSGSKFSLFVDKVRKSKQSSFFILPKKKWENMEMGIDEIKKIFEISDIKVIDEEVGKEDSEEAGDDKGIEIIVKEKLE